MSGWWRAQIRFCKLCFVALPFSAGCCCPVSLSLWNTKDPHRLSLEQKRGWTWPHITVHSPESQKLLFVGLLLVLSNPPRNVHFFTLSPGIRGTRILGWTGCRGNVLLSHHWADGQKTNCQPCAVEELLPTEHLTTFECFRRFCVHLCGVTAESLRCLRPNHVSNLPEDIYTLSGRIESFIDLSLNSTQHCVSYQFLFRKFRNLLQTCWCHCLPLKYTHICACSYVRVFLCVQHVRSFRNLIQRTHPRSWLRLCVWSRTCRMDSKDPTEKDQ